MTEECSTLLSVRHEGNSGYGLCVQLDPVRYRRMTGTSDGKGPDQAMDEEES